MSGPSWAELTAAVHARLRARIVEVADAMPGAGHAVVREACRADPELRALGLILVDLTEGQAPGPGEAVH